jgi:hypothetical protein
LFAAGKIRAIDRERVRFIVRRIVQPHERPDEPLPEKGRAERERRSAPGAARFSAALRAVCFR